MSKASQRKEAERQKRLRAGKASDSDLDALLSRKDGLLMENPVKFWTLLGQRGPKFKSHPDDVRLCESVELIKPVLATLMAGLAAADNEIAPSLALTFDFDDLVKRSAGGEVEEPRKMLGNGEAVAALAKVAISSIWVRGRHEELTESPLDWLVDETRRCESEVFVWALGVDHPSPFQLVLVVSQDGAKKAIANVGGTWLDVRAAAVKKLIDTHVLMGEVNESDEFLLTEDLRLRIEGPIDDAEEEEPSDESWSSVCDLVEATQRQGVQAAWAAACQSVARRMLDASLYEQQRSEHKSAIEALGRAENEAREARRRVADLEERLALARAAPPRVVERPAAAASTTASPPPSPQPQAPAKPTSTVNERMAVIFG